MEPLTIVLVISSAVMRARLSTSLRGRAGVQVVGVAGTAAQGVQLVRRHRPNMVLCDLLAMSDGATAAIAEQVPTPTVVLITGVESGTRGLAPVRVAEQIPFDLPPEHLIMRLRDLKAAPSSLLEALPANGHNCGQYRGGLRAAILAARGERPALPSSGQAPVAYNKRRLSVRQARLSGLLQAVQEDPRHYPRDQETGLIGIAGLHQSLALLPTVQQEAAIILIDLQAATRARTAERVLGGRSLRALSGAVRNCMRRDDLICRYGPMSWVLILPGLAPTQIPVLIERLRAALTGTLSQGEGLGLAAAVSIGFWEGVSDPAAVLMACLEAARAAPGFEPLIAAEPLATATTWRWALN